MQDSDLSIATTLSDVATVSDDYETLPARAEKRNIADVKDKPTELPRKRQKNDKTDNPSDRGVAHHPRFWASDGTAILQFQELQFKVHKSRMVNESGWFNKFFNYYESEETAQLGFVTPFMDYGPTRPIKLSFEKVESCYVYNLDSTGILAEDFEALHTAMDEAITYYFNPPQFDTVVSILRASGVFDFSTMFTFATDYLKDMFPSTLPLSSSKKAPIQEDQAMTAVALGREFSIPEILKRAFYELLCTRTVNNADTSPVHELDRTDIIHLLNAQKQLHAEWLRLLAVDVRSQYCGNDGCDSRRFLPSETHLAHDPIRGIETMRQMYHENSPCPACCENVGNVLDEFRNRIWDSMERWFSIRE